MGKHRNKRTANRFVADRRAAEMTRQSDMGGGVEMQIVQLGKASAENEAMTVENVHNHVYFYSPVDDDSCLRLMKILREVDSEIVSERSVRGVASGAEYAPIWLHVQSGGGNLMAALAVCDQLPLLSTPVYSIVEGVVASAATFIAMSCSKRLIQTRSYMMIHQLSSVAWGTYTQLQDDMHLADMLMSDMVSFYLEKTKMSEKRIRRLLARDSWFDAGSCVKHGLADEIISARSAV